jgi:hypothetical protein
MTDTPDEFMTIAEEVTQVVNFLAPLIEAAVPASIPAITIGSKIAAAFIAGEPVAVALFNRMVNGGTPVTDTELVTFAATYETAYQKTNADINVQLAKLPKD